jgi:hypothetical protein
MMASKFFTALLGLFLLLGGTAHAERQQLRGSYVSIDVPVEFAQSEQFSGLVWKKAQGSILVAEMPTEAFQRIAEQVLGNVEALQEQGIVLEARPCYRWSPRRSRSWTPAIGHASARQMDAVDRCTASHLVRDGPNALDHLYLLSHHGDGCGIGQHRS